MKNALDEICRENQNSHFIFSKVSFENRAFCKIMSKNMVGPEGPQMTSQYGAY
jgi:hypothetical protein